MIVFKRILSNLHRYLLWALLSVVIWAWIFSLVTDAPRRKKVTVIFDTVSLNEKALAEELRKDIPEGLRTIKVYHSSYMDSAVGHTDDADVYVISREKLEAALEYLCPLGRSVSEGDYVSEGEVLGWRADGACSSFASYDEGTEYYICIAKSSPHLGDGSGPAFETAERLLELP